MLVVISPETGHSELALLDELATVGMQRFHIRKPKWGEREFRSYVSELSDAVKAMSVTHQYLELVATLGLAGGHHTEYARKNNNPSLDTVCSTSFHEKPSTESATKYHYAFLSPIFKSVSKPHYLPRYGEDELRAIVQESEIELCALGGITKDTIKEVRALGFTAAAVCGAVWQSSNPIHEFISMKGAWE